MEGMAREGLRSRLAARIEAKKTLRGKGGLSKARTLAEVYRMEEQAMARGAGAGAVTVADPETEAKAKAAAAAVGIPGDMSAPVSMDQLKHLYAHLDGDVEAIVRALGMPVDVAKVVEAEAATNPDERRLDMAVAKVEAMLRKPGK